MSKKKLNKYIENPEKEGRGLLFKACRNIYKEPFTMKKNISTLSRIESEKHIPQYNSKLSMPSNSKLLKSSDRNINWK